MSDFPVLPARFVRPRALGRGAQGQTYAAFDTERGHDVAVKVFTLREREGWKGFELFERECAALRTIDHPGVPTYFEHLEDVEAGRFYLVMALVQGRPLSLDLAESRRRTEAELLTLLQRTLDILAYLHALRPPVIHRDIKPANLIVDADARVSLVDFGGVAKAFGVKGGSTMIGTFGYMAPEQLYGRAGPATDLYALGATMCALAAGVEAEELPRAGMDIDVAALVEPGPLRRALVAMCRADREQRAATVADVRAAMTESAASPSPAALPSGSATAEALVAKQAAEPVFVRPESVSPAQAWVFYGGTVAALLVGSMAFSGVLGVIMAAVFALAHAGWRGEFRRLRGSGRR